MPERQTVLVAGATGTTGSRVTARLAALGHTVRAASRTAPATAPPAGAHPVPFDWYDETTHAPALADATRAYLVPPPGDPDPAPVMLPFLERARAAGVTRVVLLGSSAIGPGGPGVGQVHQLLLDRPLFEQWSMLRPSWFMQNFTDERAHGGAIRAEGTLTTATGTGRVPFVDADDIAAVAVQALTRAPAPEHDLVVTGPEALSHDEVAATITRLTGRKVTHRCVPPPHLADRLTRLGIPAAWARVLADLDDAISEGAEDRTTDTVRRLTGRAPRAFADYYRAAGPSRSTATAPSR